MDWLRMDWLPIDWLTKDKIPVGKTMERFVDWLIDNFSGGFDTLSVVLENFIDGILWLMELPHPLLAVALIAAFTFWIKRSVGLTIGLVFGLLFIINQGYWNETLETLTLVLSSCVICMGLGVPIGVVAAHRPAVYRILRPVLDLMQTLPTFVYLIPAIVFFGIGMVPGLIATAVFVLPAPIRLTYLGIASSSEVQLEAGRAFGASRWNLLFQIELPHALPQIFAGLTQTIMLSLSMVVIAALVGADGLGVKIVRALNQVNTALGFESGFIIVVVAIMLDRMLRVTRK